MAGLFPVGPKEGESTMKTQHEPIATSEYQSVLDALGRLMDGLYRGDTAQLQEVFQPESFLCHGIWTRTDSTIGRRVHEGRLRTYLT